MIEGCGLSDPRATAAKVSMTRFNHKSWMVVNGDPAVKEPTNTRIKAEKLAVNWNWMNFLTF